MYLIDTNVVSETRKENKAHPGVIGFFDRVTACAPVYLCAVSVGELRRGVEIIRYRGDADRAALLEVTDALDQYGRNILAFGADAAQVWSRLRVPDPSHELDKQIAAIALANDLTLVTRTTAGLKGTGVKLVKPVPVELRQSPCRQARSLNRACETTHNANRVIDV